MMDFFIIKVEMPISKSGVVHPKCLGLHVYSINSQLTNKKVLIFPSLPTTVGGSL